MIAWLESIDPDVPVMIGMIFALIVVATVSCAFMVGVYHALKHRRWPLAVGSVVALGAVSLFFLTGGFEIIDEAGEAVAEAVSDIGETVDELGEDLDELGDDLSELGEELSEEMSDVVSEMEAIGVSEPRIALDADVTAPAVPALPVAPPQPVGPEGPTGPTGPDAEIADWSETEEADGVSEAPPEWVEAVRQGDDLSNDDEDKLIRVFVSDPFATVEACRAETQTMIVQWAREWAEQESPEAQLVVERAPDESLLPDLKDECDLVVEEHVAPRDTSVGRVYELYTRTEIDLPAFRELIAKRSVEIRKQRGVTRVATTGGLVLAGLATLNLWLRCGKRGGCDRTV